MALETVVRPAILPNIRPSAARTIVGSSDPEQGFAIIHGNPARQLNLTTSTSISISRSVGQELERRVDRMRVYQVTEGGVNTDGEPERVVNQDNFIDVEITNRMRLKDGANRFTRHYGRLAERDNISLLERDILYNTKSGGYLGSG